MTEPIDMAKAKRLIQEAREAREKRREERKALNRMPRCPHDPGYGEPPQCDCNGFARWPGGIDDMELES